jgi:Ca2+-binding EF-hand superfamily protein
MPQLRTIFDQIDGDKSGTITTVEVGLALRKLGHDLNKAEVGALTRNLDTSGDGNIDFDEFAGAVV